MQRTEVRHLPCDLTDRELLTKGEIVANGVQHLAELEAEKAGAAKRYGDAIKDQQSRLRLLSHEIATGREVRPVECERHTVWDERKVVTVRTDTGERVGERDMTADEIALVQQPSLFGGQRDDDNAH